MEQQKSWPSASSVPDGSPRPPPPHVCGKGGGNVGRGGQKQSAVRRLRARLIYSKSRFQQERFAKRGGPSARPFACVSPLLAASREARATPSARARRRMSRPASRAIDGASTRPPAARQSCPYVRPAADLFHAAAGSDVCGRPLIRADCPPVSR